jgi:hypothetical protein
MMTEAIATLGTVAIVSLIGPFVMLWLTGRQRADAQQLDWDRQDAVVLAAKLAADAQLEETRRGTETGQAIAAEQQQIRRVVDQTEVNTNSNLAKVQAKLDAQDARWEALIAALGQHPDAAAIFRDFISPTERDNPKEQQ